jgi:SAM-dependent methyltransferase
MIRSPAPSGDSVNHTVGDPVEDAYRAGYPPGEFVGQESLATASQALEVAHRAGIGSGTSVVDLCCGSGGFGRHLVRALGCRYLGVDRSRAAITEARRRSSGLPCTFTTATVPPIPPGRYDVVLLLETFLAFRDKHAMLSHVAQTLPFGGRFACTVEEGAPLGRQEAAAMPNAETVWPIPWGELTTLLTDAGLRLAWQRDGSTIQHRVVEGLLSVLAERREPLTRALGTGTMDALVASHRLWGDWLASGRIRKVALVAVKEAHRGRDA